MDDPFIGALHATEPGGRVDLRVRVQLYSPLFHPLSCPIWLHMRRKDIKPVYNTTPIKLYKTRMLRSGVSSWQGILSGAITPHISPTFPSHVIHWANSKQQQSPSYNTLMHCRISSQFSYYSCTIFGVLNSGTCDIFHVSLSAFFFGFGVPV